MHKGKKCPVNAPPKKKGKGPKSMKASHPKGKKSSSY